MTEKEMTTDDLQQIYNQDARPSLLERDFAERYPHPMECALRMAAARVPGALPVLFDRDKDKIVILDETRRQLAAIGWALKDNDEDLEFRRCPVTIAGLSQTFGVLVSVNRVADTWCRARNGEDLFPSVLRMLRKRGLSVIGATRGGRVGKVQMPDCEDRIRPEVREADAALVELRAQYHVLKMAVCPDPGGPIEADRSLYENDGRLSGESWKNGFWR